MGSEIYGNINFGNKIDIQKKDIKNLKGADYVETHNLLDENYYKDMKDKLRQRNMDAI